MRKLVTVLTLLVSYTALSDVPLRNWGLYNVNDSHIHAVEAWNLEKGDHSVVVAMVDTGLDATHPDLKDNLWRDPKTGVYGWDFVNDKANPVDVHGHGTHVAGIVAGRINLASGTAGVAPNVSLMSLKYYSDSNTGAENLRNGIKSLRWAISHGAKIINYSGGGPEWSKEEYAAVKDARDKGILIVAAAGNDHQDMSNPYSDRYFPCAYKLDNVVCVTATTITNQIMNAANYGHSIVTLAAPGENILSTAPKGYVYMSGTSQATAFVSGVAALILSRRPTLTPAQVSSILEKSVDKLDVLKDKTTSGGRVNAYRALLTSP